MIPHGHEPVDLTPPRSLGPRRLLASFLALALLAAAYAPPAAAAPPLSKERLQGLLQAFVDQAYLKAFRTLGDERDFDHGHVLFDSEGPQARALAILYHTQELAYYQAAGSGFEYIDPESRNWVQRLSDGRVENAKLYERRAYPPSPRWDFFQALELPALRRHHTILADMLDPAAFGAAELRSRQWVFTRASCPSPVKPGAERIAVRLPGAGRVCLSLSSY